MAAMMRARSWKSLVGFGLAVSAILAQDAPASSGRSIVGTVAAVSESVISVRTGTQVIPVAVDQRTEIWKGAVFHDTSPLRVGDDILARARIDSNGALVAEAVWLDIVNFSAVVTGVRASGFEVLTNPNADPQSAYKSEHKTVNLAGDTVFEASTRGDVRVGRTVQVVGLDLRNGTVRATRVTVYEGNRPVRLDSAPGVLPNGSVR